MNKAQKTLLRLLQTDFPLCERPFAHLGEQSGLSEGEVIELVERWLRDGLIRRIGPTFEPAELGFKTTLCAVSVSPERLEEAAAKINALPGVTHNYLREHQFNLWFTLTAQGEDALREIIAGLERELGLTILNLPAEHRFKLQVQFDAVGEE
ncbi:MAG: Lrp/AsnC family transcriptional regulator [Desulfovibrionaceae bacterium]|nr:Lrp/AsnC family transcriptional regulator [Desulfovibrionaceae bacterium]